MIAREIEGSGSPPKDLKNLASRLHTKGTDKLFQTHAVMIHNQIMHDAHVGEWSTLVVTHNSHCQELIHTGECRPAKATPDQDASAQALIAKMVDSRLECLKSSSNAKPSNNGGDKKTSG